MLQRRTVVLAAYNKINRFSRNIQPQHVRAGHADEVVAAKRQVYQDFLRKLHRELEDPAAVDELICESSTVDVFERFLAEISAQHEALHDITRVLMNSHLREGHAPPAERTSEAVAAFTG